MSEQKKVLQLLNLKKESETDRIDNFLESLDMVKKLVSEDKVAQIIVIVDEEATDDSGDTDTSFMFWDRTENPDITIAKLDKVKTFLIMATSEVAS